LVTLTPPILSHFFFFTDTPTTQIYTLSLHDALPISDRWSPWSYYSARGAAHRAASPPRCPLRPRPPAARRSMRLRNRPAASAYRSEEHTSELQSRGHLVCRLLLEKKKNKRNK